MKPCFVKSKNFQKAVALLFFPIAAFSADVSLNPYLDKVGDRQYDLDLNVPPAEGIHSISQISEFALAQFRDACEGSGSAGHFCFKDGKALVEVRTASRADSSTVQTFLKPLGFDVATSSGRILVGWLPVEFVVEAQNHEAVEELRLVPRPTANLGLAENQGEVALLADVVKQRYALDGSGIRIGIVSTSYDLLGDANASVLAGDLPGMENPNGFTDPVTVLQEGIPGLFPDNVDEGRAIAEVIHDIAPGAELYFHAMTGGTPFILADAMQALADAGCDIIVDDIGTSARITPFYQDAAAGRKIQELTDSGIIYFTSAGNIGRKTFYEVPYSASPFINASSDDTVDLDPSDDVFNPFLVIEPTPGAPSFGFEVSFQWDQPWATYSEGGVGASNSLTLLVLDPNFNVLFAETSPLGGDPALGVIANNLNPNIPLALVFLKPRDGSPVPSRIKLRVDAVNARVAEPIELSIGSAFGHNNPPAGFSIGSSSWFNTPAGSLLWNAELAGLPTPDGQFVSTTPVRETPVLSFEGGPSVIFSETVDGPFVLNTPSPNGSDPILFGPDGSRLPIPEIRQNPTLIAADGVETTFFGRPIRNLNGRRLFFGTSCSAPNAAAVAALVLQAARNEFSPEQVGEVLIDTAVDMDDPYIDGLQVDPTDPLFSTGYDRASGFGLVNAEAAVDQVIAELGIQRLAITPLCEDGESRTWLVTNPNGFGVESVLTVSGAGFRLNPDEPFEQSPADVVIPPGESTLETEKGSPFTCVSLRWLWFPNFEEGQPLTFEQNQQRQSGSVSFLKRGGWEFCE